MLEESQEDYVIYEDLDEDSLMVFDPEPDIELSQEDIIFHDPEPMEESSVIYSTDLVLDSYFHCRTTL